MTPEQQIDALDTEIMSLIIRFSEEFDISTAAMIGVLELCKLRIIDGRNLDFESDLFPEE